MEGVLVGNSKIGGFNPAREGAVGFFEIIISGNWVIGAKSTIESCHPAGWKAGFDLQCWEAAVPLGRFLLADCRRLGPELLRLLGVSLLDKFSMLNCLVVFTES